jgi:hypothetical protein
MFVFWAVQTVRKEKRRLIFKKNKINKASMGTVTEREILEEIVTKK